MATYDLLRDLTESKLLPTYWHIHEFTAQDTLEIVYMYLLILYVFNLDPHIRPYCQAYCRQTLTAGNFRTKVPNGNDLYVLLHCVFTKTGFKKDHSLHKLSAVLITPHEIREFLLMIINGVTKPDSYRRFLLNLDNRLIINDSSLRAVRRLIMDWTVLSHSDHQLAITRTLQMLRHRAPRSELLPPLQRFADNHQLEMKNVCNPETGEGCSPVTNAVLPAAVAAAAGFYMGKKAREKK